MAKITVDLGDGKKATVEVGSLAQEDTLRDLLRVMEGSGRVTATNAMNTRRSQDEIDRLGESADGAADSLEETAVSFEEASRQVEASASQVKTKTSEAMKTLKSEMFNNTKSLFAGMSSPMGFLKDSASSLGDGFGGLVKGAASAGGATGMVARGMLMLGGPITLIGTAIMTFVGFLVGRAMKNLEMYDKILKSGATFAGGLEQFRDTVTQSSLNLDDFTAVATRNAAKFATFGGSVAQGAVKFAAVSKEVGKFGTSFRNLGFSAEEMGDVQAAYMEQLAISGDLTGKNAKSDAQVAAGAMDYAKSLKVMTALTGQSIEDAKAARAEKVRDYRIQMAARELQSKYGMSATDAANAMAMLKESAPGMEDAVTDMILNNGQIVTEAGLKNAATAENSTNVLYKRFGDVMSTFQSGATDQMSVAKAIGKTQSEYAAANEKDMKKGSLMELAARSTALGATNTFSDGVTKQYEAFAQSGVMLKNYDKTVAEVAAAESDRDSLAARQHALEATAYAADKIIKDKADAAALQAGAVLQKALIRLAVVMYKIPGFGKLPEDLKKMAEAFDEEDAAAKRKIAADKAAAASVSAQAKVAQISQTDPKAMENLTQKVMSYGVISRDALNTGFLGLSDKLEKKEGESDEAFSARKVEAVKQEILAASAKGSGPNADLAARSKVEQDLRMKLSELQASSATKGMSQDELKALLKDMYKQQGLLIGENFDKVTAIQANAVEAGAQAATPSVPASPGEAPAGQSGEGHAKGGVVTGSKQGFPATLHGTEAVVPLPDNKAIPVNLTMPKSLTRIVAQGETLSGIAIKSQTTVDAIMKANPQLTDPNKIRAGAAINIPSTTPPTAAAIEKPQAAEGGMFSGLRAGFDSILKSVQDALPTAESIEKTVTELTTTAETKSIDNVRAAMIEVRDLIKSQNELLTDLLDNTKDGVRVQKDIRSNSY